MEDAKPKQFEFYSLFPSNNLDKWALFKVRVGVGLRYSFRLVGSIRIGEHGMAIFGMNDKFVDVVPRQQFVMAAKKLSVDEFHMVYKNEEVFQDWVIQKEDDYWNNCGSATSIIHDFNEGALSVQEDV